MRFLADESCDFRVVRSLRAAGYDVSAIVELAPGAADKTVADIAQRERRILLTEDRDFGQLVYARVAGASPAGGVILLRYPSTARAGLPGMVVEMAQKYGQRLLGRFVVVEPGRVRFGGGWKQ